MEDLVHLHVTLHDGSNDEPVKGEAYKIQFFDKDLLKDDPLGESNVDDFGHAQVTVKRSDFRSLDSPLEKYPDIYFKLLKNGSVVYESHVFKNLHLEDAKHYPASEGILQFNLGTFLIPDPQGE